jgi:hypothetical protein
LHTPFLNNAFNIGSAGGKGASSATLLIDNINTISKGAFSGFSNSNLLISGTGSLDAPVVQINTVTGSASVPAGTAVVTQGAIGTGNLTGNGEGGNEDVLVGAISGGLTLNITGNQNFLAIGNSSAQLTTGGAMNLTLTGPLPQAGFVQAQNSTALNYHPNNQFDLNLQSALGMQSGSSISIVLSNGNLCISCGSTWYQAGISGGSPIYVADRNASLIQANTVIEAGSSTAPVTITATNGSVNAILNNLVGSLTGTAGSVNGGFAQFVSNSNAVNSAMTNTSGQAVDAQTYNLTDASYNFTVAQGSFNVGANGVSSKFGSVVLQAMDPTQAVAYGIGQGSGGVLSTNPNGNGGALTIGGNVSAAFNVTIAGTQAITINTGVGVSAGTVVSGLTVGAQSGYTGKTDPINTLCTTCLQNNQVFQTTPKNSTTPEQTFGGTTPSGATNLTVYGGCQNCIPMNGISVNNQGQTVYGSSFNSIGAVVIDNINPYSPGVQISSSFKGGSTAGQGAFEPQGSSSRNVTLGNNVTLTSSGGEESVTLSGNLVSQDNGTATGGTFLLSANNITFGNHLQVISYGGNVIIDAANNIGPSAPSVTAPLISSIAAIMPQTTLNQGSTTFLAANAGLGVGLITSRYQGNLSFANLINGGTLDMAITSGGGVGIYAGEALGVFKSINGTPTSPLVSPTAQLAYVNTQKNVVTQLNICCAQKSLSVSGLNNNSAVSFSGGLATIIFEQQPSTMQQPVTQFNKGVTNVRFAENGGVIVIDPPTGNASINLANALIYSVGAPIILNASSNINNQIINAAGISSGSITTIAVAPVVPVTAAVTNFSTEIPTLSSAVVATDSTRSTTLALQQQALSLLDQNRLRKEAGTGTNAYYIAGGACQPFFLEDDQDTMMVGEKGTAFKPGDNRTVNLQQGKIVAMVGKMPIKVTTGFGDVSVAGNSAAIVEQKNGITRIANLSGKSTTVTLNRNGEVKTLTAQAGEELCIADDSLSEEELIPVDGVDRTPIIGSVVVPGVKIAHNKFDQKMMMAKEKLLVCNAGSFYQTKAKVNALRNKVEKEAKPLQHTAPANPKPLQKSMLELPKLSSFLNKTSETKEEDENEMMEPISFSQPSGPNKGVHSFTTRTAIVKHNGKASIGFEHPTVMKIDDGEVLVSAEQQTIVKTPHSLITINPNTIALITVEGNKVTKVRNLWELGNRDIRQTVNGNYVDIAAGEESVLGWDQVGVSKSIAKDSLGRRKSRGIEVPGGMYMQRAEVPLTTLMQPENSAFLSDLVNSNNAQDRALANKLVKMAAVLQQVTAKHGQFVQLSPGNGPAHN